MSDARANQTPAADPLSFAEQNRRRFREARILLTDAAWDAVIAFGLLLVIEVFAAAVGWFPNRDAFEVGPFRVDRVFDSFAKVAALVCFGLLMLRSVLWSYTTLRMDGR